jgi:signal transduction histidine kinase
MLVTGLALVVVAIGIPLTVLALRATRALATIERHRARWVGPPIPPRPVQPVTGGWWRRFRDRLADPDQWRYVGFFLAGTIVVPALFALAAGGWAALISVASLAVTERDLLALAVAILLTGAAARLAVLAGRVAHAYVAWFLGPDRTAELEARVDTLSTQRQEILDAVAAERRRIERNLHDGVQQQLVALGIDIGRAAARIETDPDEARRLLDDAREKVRGSVGELRMIGRGLHPAILGDRGLDAALSAVVAGAPIPVEIDIEPIELPIDLAETAYFVANEALANALKHAHARVASVHLARSGDVVTLVIHDDGRGGAERTGAGTGLAGMAARVAAVDGRLVVDSPTGGPTVVTAVLPLTGATDHPDLGGSPA